LDSIFRVEILESKSKSDLAKHFSEFRPPERTSLEILEEEKTISFSNISTSKQDEYTGNYKKNTHDFELICTENEMFSNKC